MLLVSTCYHALSNKEFLEPLKSLISANNIAFETKSYKDVIDHEKYDRIIICGTALRDFDYMKNADNFSWIKNYKGKILGICSGAQIIASVFGKDLEDCELIGKMQVSINKKNKLAEGCFSSYFLVSKKPSLDGELIALDEDGYVFKHKEREAYGVLFHPEVLNEKIIKDFSA